MPFIKNVGFIYQSIMLMSIYRHFEPIQSIDHFNDARARHRTVLKSLGHTSMVHRVQVCPFLKVTIYENRIRKPNDICLSFHNVHRLVCVFSGMSNYFSCKIKYIISVLVMYYFALI